MDEAIDTAATVATGAMLAREAERMHAPGHDSSGACANCGALLTGPYCATCGQHGHVHRTAGALLHDLAHGVFHFEGKVWATLPLLARRPGELTRRYVHGERARFVSPVALFLFSVFVMFAVLGNMPGFTVGDGGFLTKNLDMQKMGADIAAERLKTEGDIAKARRRIAAEQADRSPDLDVLRREARRLSEATKLRKSLLSAQRFVPAPDAAAAKKAEPSNWFEAKWRHAKENPKLLLYKIKTSAYKYSWALIPLSLPFIWLLFPFRRDVGLYDHAIFATYSLSFMSLFAVLLALLTWAGLPTAIVVLAALIVPPLHLYRQIKGAYTLGRLGALWRTAWMLMFASISVTLFSLLLLYLGAE